MKKQYAIYQLNVGGMFRSPVFEVKEYGGEELFAYPLISYASKDFAPNRMVLCEIAYPTKESALERIEELKNDFSDSKAEDWGL